MRWHSHIVAIALGIVCHVGACAPSPGTRELKSLAPEYCPPSAPTPTPLRLLTRAEYDHTVRDLLGDRSEPSRGFPREPLSDGFDNDAAVNRVGPDHLVRYLQAAESLALRAISEGRDALLGCTTSDDACAQAFIARFGRRAFRRPLSETERSTMHALFSEGQAAGGFDEGIRWTLEAFLQAPQFLYRDERLPDLGGALDGYRLATRLSYALWASTPDDALLDAAERGELADSTTRELQVRRLLADPRATEAKLRYFSLWLGMEGMETLRKDLGSYPQFTPELASNWRASLELYLRDVLARGGDLKTLLTLESLYVNAAMPMYAESAHLGAELGRVERREYAGLLAQPSFLAKLAAPDQSSPVRRGVFVLDRVMCQPPPPPPANANLVPPTPSQATTTRERFSSHAADGCATCHDRIDGIGFLFENYDALGAWRSHDNGKGVDASGEVRAARDGLIDGRLSGVEELSLRLATSGQVSDCMASQWLRFSLGRELGVGDTCSLYAVQRRFAEADGSFDELLVAIAESEAFLSHVAASEAEEAP